MSDFHDADALLDRLSRANPSRKHAFLFGSALTAPARAGDPGVPGVPAMVELLRDHYRRSYPARALDHLDRALAAAASPYQAAFRDLQGRGNVDDANALIRRAVLQAHTGARPPEAADADACTALERDLAGWHLPPWVRALGELLARPPAGFSPLVLTTNFDPLIQVAIERAGGLPPRSTVLDADGRYGQSHGPGCHVVHLHGHWTASDTLHTDVQLKRPRPLLQASLEATLGSHALVVLGYGGWDDVFLAALAAAAERPLLKTEILWAFYDGDEDRIRERNQPLLSRLCSGALDSRRVALYKGVNLRELLPALRTRLLPAPGAAPAPASAPASAPPGPPPAPPASAAAVARVTCPTQRSLYRVFVRLEPTFAELDELLNQHFPAFRARLGPDMDLRRRTNLLFEQTGLDAAFRARLLDALRESFETRLAPLEALLQEDL